MGSKAPRATNRTVPPQYEASYNALFTSNLRPELDSNAAFCPRPERGDENRAIANSSLDDGFMWGLTTGLPTGSTGSLLGSLLSSNSIFDQD